MHRLADWLQIRLPWIGILVTCILALCSMAPCTVSYLWRASVCIPMTTCTVSYLWRALGVNVPLTCFRFLTSRCVRSCVTWVSCWDIAIIVLVWRLACLPVWHYDSFDPCIGASLTRFLVLLCRTVLRRKHTAVSIEISLNLM